MNWRRRIWPIRTPLLSEIGARNALVALAAGFLAASAVSLVRSHSPAGKYAPSYKLTRGEEIEATLVVSSHCHFGPDFPRAVDEMKLALARQAAQAGANFAAGAVVIDWSPEAADRFVQTFGKFDELSLGRNWLNAGVVHYVWRNLPGESRSPQLIVVRRFVQPEARSITVGADTVMLRLIGIDKIESWVRSGAPLPGFGTETARIHRGLRVGSASRAVK